MDRLKASLSRKSAETVGDKVRSIMPFLLSQCGLSAGSDSQRLPQFYHVLIECLGVSGRRTLPALAVPSDRSYLLYPFLLVATAAVSSMRCRAP